MSFARGARSTCVLLGGIDLTLCTRYAFVCKPSTQSEYVCVYFEYSVDFLPPWSSSTSVLTGKNDKYKKKKKGEKNPTNASYGSASLHMDFEDCPLLPPLMRIKPGSTPLAPLRLNEPHGCWLQCCEARSARRRCCCEIPEGPSINGVACRVPYEDKSLVFIEEQ